MEASSTFPIGASGIASTTRGVPLPEELEAKNDGLYVAAATQESVLIEEFGAEMEETSKGSFDAMNPAPASHESLLSNELDADEADEPGFVAASQESLPSADLDAGAEAEEDAPNQEAADSQHATRDIQELLYPPPHLAYMRQKLFEIKDPIELKPEEFNRYWPFVDNVWVRQHKPGTDKSGHPTTEYWACRLRRATYMPRKSNEPRPEGKPLRKKQTREGRTCQVRIKMMRYHGGCEKITICRRSSQEHTHNLDHMDHIKRNSVIMDVARAEVMKGYMPVSVFTMIYDQVQHLNNAGGRHLTRHDVRNASQAWRQLYHEPLAVHPGYTYDHGNGIVRTMSTSNPASSTYHSSQTENLLLPLPQSTLFFPPASRAFLTPYLPPWPAPLPPGSLPHVTLTYATSMDSFLAIQPGMPTPLSGPISKAMTHYFRSCHDAILIGVGTALADDPSLNCRLAGAGGFGGLGWEYQPRPVVIDPGARWLLSPDRAVIQTAARGQGLGPWIIIAPGFAIDPVRLEFVRHHGGKYLGMPDTDADSRLRWDSIFRALAAEGIRSVLVEGGGVVINELLQPRHASLIAAVVVTVAPRYLGAGGVPVCPPRAVDNCGRAVTVASFCDVRWTQLGDDVVMCGRLGGSVAAEATRLQRGCGVDSGIGVELPGLVGPGGRGNGPVNEFKPDK